MGSVWWESGHREKLGVFHMVKEPRRSGSSFELRIQSLCSYLLSCIAIAHTKNRIPGPRVREGPQPSEGAVSGLCSSGHLDGAESGEASTSDLKVEVSVRLLWMSESKKFSPHPKKEESILIILAWLPSSLSICPIYCDVDLRSSTPKSGWMFLCFKVSQPQHFDIRDWIILCCAL